MRAHVTLDAAELAAPRGTKNMFDRDHQMVCLGPSSSDAVAYLSAVEARQIADAWVVLADQLAEAQAWRALAGLS